MTKKNIIQFDPFADEHITPEIIAARDNAKPRLAKFKYHREHRTVAISVTVAEHARLKAAARQRGCTLSELIRPQIDQLLADLGGC